MPHEDQPDRTGTHRYIRQGCQQRGNIDRIERRKLIRNFSRRQLSPVQQGTESILQGIALHLARLPAHDRR